jgi:hypothetical protein
MNEYIYDAVFNSEAFQKTLDIRDAKIWSALSVYRSCYTMQPEEKKADQILRYFFDQGNTKFATSLFLLRHASLLISNLLIISINHDLSVSPPYLLQ